MHCTVKEAQRRVDSAAFTEWRAFERLYPLPEHRIDEMGSLIALRVSGIPFEPDRAAPYREPEPLPDPEAVADEVAAKINAMFGRFTPADPADS